MKFGRYVTVDDNGNYVTFHELNVRIKIKCYVSRAERLHNNSSQRELRPVVPHTVLRLKQVNFKARLHDLKNRLFFLVLSVSRPKLRLTRPIVVTG